MRRSERAAFGVGAMATACAVALVAAVPSWAQPRPEPRPEAGAAARPAAAAPSNSDLEVIRLDPDEAPPGGTTTVHAFVANRGPDTTASPFTVLVTLPEGFTPQYPYFPSDCEVLRHGRLVRCVFGAGLKPLKTATALVPVRLDPELRPGTYHGHVEVRSADDQVADNNRQPFDLVVVETAAGS